MSFWCLHGFLGRASDWEFLPGAQGPELCSLLGESDTLDTWAEKAVAQAPKDSVLVGYSMGGRLAMHALAKDPSRFKAAILVSCHPGLTSADERSVRLVADGIWARRFETSPWDALMQEWNAQPVFGNRSEPFPRREADYDRAALARCLRQGSLGHQRDFRPMLKKLSTPVLWIAGENDSRYAALAREVQLGKNGRVEVFPEVAHRVPWEAGDRFLSRLEAYLSESRSNRS